MRRVLAVVVRRGEEDMGRYAIHTPAGCGSLLPAYAPPRTAKALTTWAGGIRSTPIPRTGGMRFAPPALRAINTEVRLRTRPGARLRASLALFRSNRVRSHP